MPQMKNKTMEIKIYSLDMWTILSLFRNLRFFSIQLTNFNIGHRPFFFFFLIYIKQGITFKQFNLNTLKGKRKRCLKETFYFFLKNLKYYYRFSSFTKHVKYVGPENHIDWSAPTSRAGFIISPKVYTYILYILCLPMLMTPSWARLGSRLQALQNQDLPHLGLTDNKVLLTFFFFFFKSLALAGPLFKGMIDNPTHCP